MVNGKFDFGKEKAAFALNSFLPEKDLETFVNAHSFTTTDNVIWYTIKDVDGNYTSTSWNNGMSDQKINRTVRSSSDAFRDVGNHIVDFTGHTVPGKKDDNISSYYSETIRVLKKDKEPSTVSSNENDLEYWEGATSYTTSTDKNATTSDAITIYKRSSKGHTFDHHALAVEFVTVAGVGNVRRCTFLKEMKSDDDNNQNLTARVLTNVMRTLLKNLQ
jgi:hypothetical protein